MSIPSRKVRSVYLASPWVAREQAKEAREKLQAMGLRVTSRWIDTHNSNSTAPASVYVEEAVDDLHDIQRADGFVLLALPGSSGGMFTEMGYALGLGKPVWVVSEQGLKMPTCIFYYHPMVTVVPSVWDVTLDKRVASDGVRA